jgi:N-acetyl-anhydromuramyl-L-alanine amidase AmpD
MRVTDLVEYLMYNFGIPKENVLRHSDITQTNKALRDQKILWDGKQQARKTDVALTFFPGGFTTWRDQLVPRKDSRYAA